MLDVGAMAIWLNKPLGVRLLPIPGKVAGDVTDFQHDFFINTRIQATRAHQGFGTGFGNAQPFGYLRDDGPRAPSGISSRGGVGILCHGDCERLRVDPARHTPSARG